MLKKKIVILDSANRSNTSTDASFSWNITSQATTNNFLSGRSLVSEEITNVRKIVVSTINIPISPLLEPIYNNIRCYLEYITNSSYFGDLEDNFTPFHFNFNIAYDKRSRRLNLTPTIDSIDFNPPMTNLQNVQLTFYDPYGPYTLPLDYTSATLSNAPIAYSSYSMFTVNPSYPVIPINTGDAINIVTNINSPSINYNGELNSTNTFNILKLSQTVFLIYTINPMPVGYTQSNILIYYSSNRFNISLEVYYEKKNNVNY